MSMIEFHFVVQVLYGLCFGCVRLGVVWSFAHWLARVGVCGLSPIGASGACVLQFSMFVYLIACVVAVCDLLQTRLCACFTCLFIRRQYVHMLVLFV